jgi:lipid-A-disaccharide synthase
VLLESAARLTREMARPLAFILPVAPTLEEGLIRKMIDPYLKQGLPIQLVKEDSRQALAACHHAIVASGTVTLEAAILGVPILIVYKVSPLNYWIARHLIRVPYIGLVNWVAGRKIIPELIQDQAQPEAIAEASRRFLTDPDYTRRIREELVLVRDSLGGPGASARVAKIVLEMTN